MVVSPPSWPSSPRSVAIAYHYCCISQIYLCHFHVLLSHQVHGSFFGDTKDTSHDLTGKHAIRTCSFLFLVYTENNTAVHRTVINTTMNRLVVISTLIATATAFTGPSASVQSSSTRLQAQPLDPRQSRSMNAMDNNRGAPSWTQADASPASGYSAPASSGGGDSAVFDPPKRDNLWTNFQDKPRGERKGLSRFL
jgi:hypothetical protein